MTELPQYLEGDNSNGDATYQAGPPTATFNDQLLAITRDMLMPSVEQRVARQARKCLENFAATAGGRYPFAAPIGDVTYYADGIPPTGPPPYTTINWGRVPATLNATSAALGGAYSWPTDDPQPGAATACFASGTWWDNWRELLLYRVAAAYAPSASIAGPCGGTCLRVSSAADSAADVKVVVVVAGRAFTSPSQTARLTVPSSKTNPTSYLERYQPASTTFDNVSALISGTFQFGKAPRIVTTGPLGGFNDRVECVSQSASSTMQLSGACAASRSSSWRSSFWS